MKWDDLRRSRNVEDRRGTWGGGLGRGVSIGGGGIILVLLASLLFGVNPLDVLGGLQGTPPTAQVQQSPANDRTADFVKAVLGDTEDTWNTIFQQQLGADYQEPRLVLFSGGVESACGFAQTASGPFYCPLDQRVYLDTAFFRQIQAAAGPDADFARAYAIAHEVGHHIQHLLGISDQVQRQMARSSTGTRNALSVRLELQADCLAGVWGHYTAQRGIIDNADVRAALATAAQIGDDYLQKESQGYVVPDAFTHGSSEQRVSWFRRGLQSGDIRQCGTFN